MNNAIAQITALELDARISRSDDLTVIDVREPWEVELASVHGTIPIPLAGIPASITSLDRNREYVMMCHHGARSEAAAQWLQRQGFTRIINLDGGIDAWSREVDPSVPQY